MYACIYVNQKKKQIVNYNSVTGSILCSFSIKNIGGKNKRPVYVCASCMTLMPRIDVDIATHSHTDPSQTMFVSLPFV